MDLERNLEYMPIVKVFKVYLKLSVELK